MKIAGLAVLDKGAKGITVEGEVKYTKDPKHVVLMPKDGKPEVEFDEQFFVLQDGPDKATDSIAVVCRVDDGFSVQKGDRVKIDGAELDEYQGKRSLRRGKVAEIGTGTEAAPTAQAPEAPKGDAPPAPVKAPAAPAARQWVPDREKDYYCLTENINTAVSVIVAAMHPEIEKMGVVIATVHGALLENSIAALAKLGKVTAPPAAPAPKPEGFKVAPLPGDGVSPDEIPF